MLAVRRDLHLESGCGVTRITLVAPLCNFAWVCTIRTVGQVTPNCLRPPGLREAKKERTRTALSAAALELVSTRGYEATTVDAIAHEAGVSVRTFHNYFPGKAAALAHLAADLVSEYHDELRALPDSLSCAHALRDAWRSMLDRHREDVAALTALIDAIESNPDLRRYLQDSYPEVTAAGVAEVARRLDTDPATSAVPHVVTEMTFTIAVAVIRLHATPEFADRTQEHLLDEAFSALPLLVAAPATDTTVDHTV